MLGLFIGDALDTARLQYMLPSSFLRLLSLLLRLHFTIINASLFFDLNPTKQSKCLPQTYDMVYWPLTP